MRALPSRFQSVAEAVFDARVEISGPVSHSRRLCGSGVAQITSRPFPERPRCVALGCSLPEATEMIALATPAGSSGTGQLLMYGSADSPTAAP